MRRPAGHRGSQEDLNADASYFALKNSVDAHGVIGLRAGVRERSALSGRLGGNLGAHRLFLSIALWA